MTALKTAGAALLAVGTLALAGCGSGTTGAGPSTVTAPGTVPTTTATDGGASTPSATTSASTPAGLGLCRTADLTLSKGRSDGTAGSTYTPLIFTNTGSKPCTVTGFPGVSLAAGNTGDPIGAPADRDKPKPTITLGVNEQASALLRITDAGNYGDRCQPVTAAGLRIYPPDNTESIFLPAQISACANSDVHLLEISSLVPGATGS
ncbi:DUF4232 domain-containing protein [Nocardia sp. NBC_01327]|uniref:DUF4232 domain-containing protein n=1 Tax=Nocardia sp. NBC_01327 TaxID=2903593 RepID=UPI002E14AECB|nr:DUF4232 domain-containing protein [Nocardia sp. NBC_01327]